VRGHTTNDQSVTSIKISLGIEIDYVSSELSNVNEILLYIGTKMEEMSYN